jgi:hypothetical protein
MAEHFTFRIGYAFEKSLIFYNVQLGGTHEGKIFTSFENWKFPCGGLENHDFQSPEGSFTQAPH